MAAGARCSPFFVVDAATPWLLRVRTDASGVQVTLTDLLGVFEGSCDLQSAQEQVTNWGGAHLQQLLALLHKQLEDGEEEPAKQSSKFLITRVDEVDGAQGTAFGEDHSTAVRVQWEVKKIICLAWICRRSDASAEKLRDEHGERAGSVKENASTGHRWQTQE